VCGCGEGGSKKVAVKVSVHDLVMIAIGEFRTSWEEKGGSSS